MKNRNFEISLNAENGNVLSIKNPNDIHQMNWCLSDGNWGRVHFANMNRGSGNVDDNIALVDFWETEDEACSIYKNEEIQVRIIRRFNEQGNLVEQMTVKNLTGTVYCLTRDKFGIEFPLNDKYTGADECMIHHCHTHLWCGHNTAWIDALRMGDSDINLGIYFTKGAIDCYNQNSCRHSTRGVFVLGMENIMLKAEEEYVLEWELFWHSGKEDFIRQLLQFENHIQIDAKHYTVFLGEKIEFSVKSMLEDTPKIVCDNEEIPFTLENGVYHVCFQPKKIGAYRIKVYFGERYTYADFMVKLSFRELLEKRIDFIIDHQQCMDETNPLYGAYLVYDNKTDTQFFDFNNQDHNACRERMNLSILLARYYRFVPNEKVRKSLEVFSDFVFREFYEEETGEVFNNIGKSRDQIRLYNSPGVMLFFAEMYLSFQNERYLDNILKLARQYYSVGGEKCYANGLCIETVISAFRQSGRKEDTEELLVLFKKHVDHMVSIGTSYPAHEVIYEQTIVTPAVKHIAEYAMYAENKKAYTDTIAPHLSCLERFSGHQPSSFLNEIAIRFWDDYWFGKGAVYGDTLPHHLSVLTARGYLSYYRLTGEMQWREKAEECIRNCMCLIGDDGRGFAAYVYPYKIGGIRGEFFDEWSNDQDLVLYDALLASDVVESFVI